MFQEDPIQIISYASMHGNNLRIFTVIYSLLFIQDTIPEESYFFFKKQKNLFYRLDSQTMMRVFITLLLNFIPFTFYLLETLAPSRSTSKMNVLKPGPLKNTVCLSKAFVENKLVPICHVDF